MRPVKFSRHAKNRMRLHRIKNEEVLSAISDQHILRQEQKEG